MKNIIDKLNQQQKRAVENTEGPMLIVAGAGSGKTRVITYKIAHIVASKLASPSQVTAVTFTNKATAEMKNRIQQILCEELNICSRQELSAMTVATFHSFCTRVLRENYQLVGLGRDFLIYDSDDQRDLISSILDVMKIDKKIMNPKDMVSLFSCVKNGMFDMRPGSETARIYEEYQKELIKVLCI